MRDISEEKNIQMLFDFMRAQKEAEKSGKKEFTCPLCGGEAWWGRAPSNGHLHCGCRKCGFRLME